MTAPNKDPAARVDELEAHVAHQDGAIQDLSDMVLKQWDAIKSLIEKVDGLEAQQHALENEISGGPRDEPPPPHY
jgi:uncharacterized coiled-coil protein SlyX